jgi:hypothetical protein
LRQRRSPGQTGARAPRTSSLPKRTPLANQGQQGSALVPRRNATRSGSQRDLFQVAPIRPTQRRKRSCGPKPLRCARGRRCQLRSRANERELEASQPRDAREGRSRLRRAASAVAVSGIPARTGTPRWQVAGVRGPAARNVRERGWTKAWTCAVPRAVRADPTSRWEARTPAAREAGRRPELERLAMLAGGASWFARRGGFARGVAAGAARSERGALHGAWCERSTEQRASLHGFFATHCRADG